MPLKRSMLALPLELVHYVLNTSMQVAQSNINVLLEKKHSVCESRCLLLKYNSHVSLFMAKETWVDGVSF